MGKPIAVEIIAPVNEIASELNECFTSYDIKSEDIVDMKVNTVKAPMNTGEYEEQMHCLIVYREQT